MFFGIHLFKSTFLVVVMELPERQLEEKTGTAWFTARTAADSSFDLLLSVPIRRALKSNFVGMNSLGGGKNIWAGKSVAGAVTLFTEV